MHLLAFGSNGSGQLGIGHLDDVSAPEPCIFEDHAPPASTISRIAAGGNHTLLLLEDGAVYAAGCNEDGRCGPDPATSNDSSFTTFRKVVVEDAGTGRVFERFKHVAATWEAGFLVAVGSDLSDEEGEEVVFAMGSGSKGELGLGSACTQASRATRIEDFPPRGTRVKSMASGMGHAVVVLSNGEVYGWGGARKGQLGESVKRDKIAWSPVKIEGVAFRAEEAVCGREFTAVTGDREKGEFMILGSADNKWGILSDAPAPSSGALQGYRSIGASWHGVYVHQTDSSLLAWGKNDRGQLPPADLPKPEKVAVGSEHALALLGDGTVVAFGWGEHGNCGPETDAQGNVKGRYSVIPLSLGEGVVVAGIGAGCATSWIVTS